MPFRQDRDAPNSLGALVTGGSGRSDSHLDDFHGHDSHWDAHHHDSRSDNSRCHALRSDNSRGCDSNYRDFAHS
jgi:hypothetical protein